MFSITTNNNLALDSLDYLQPLGNLNDNLSHKPFLFHIEELLTTRPLKMIDFGCAGGGLVNDFLENYHIAIGLDGSSASYNIKRASWRTIPNNLFLCDCAKPFQISYGREVFKADIITSFEFFEHIHKDNISQVCANIRNHLSQTGFSIHGIANFESSHHVTVEGYDWWISQFEKNGFIIRKDIIDKFQANQLPHYFQTGQRCFIAISL